MRSSLKSDVLDILKEKLRNFLEATEEKPEEKKIVLVDPSKSQGGEPEINLRTIGLFSDILEEPIAELVHALMYMNETNKDKEEEDKEPIEFYLSTYGGSADDMFALYDIMKDIQKRTEIHTVGVGKVMSAGVPLLACGTKGKRKIAKNCRIMIHSVSAGNQGNIHDLVNELEAVEELQKMYINCLVEETKMTESQLKKMLKRKVNVYLSAEQAIKLGIADEIL
jgi:ATP-dependent Clp protease protease subunit